MAQSRVYVGIIQPLDYTPFEGDDGKAIFAKGLEEAGEVLEAWKAVRDTKDSFKKNRALEHLKTDVVLRRREKKLRFRRIGKRFLFEMKNIEIIHFRRLPLINALLSGSRFFLNPRGKPLIDAGDLQDMRRNKNQNLFHVFGPAVGFKGPSQNRNIFQPRPARIAGRIGFFGQP